MLDLRQLETLAPSSRGPSRDSLAMTSSGSGKHGQQPPETLQVSQFLLVPWRSPSSLSQQLESSTGPVMLALPLWRMGNPNCKFRVRLPGGVMDLGRIPWEADGLQWWLEVCSQSPSIVLEAQEHEVEPSLASWCLS